MRKRFANWLDPQHATFAAVRETDDTITSGRANWDDSFRNRLTYDRQRVLEKIINSCRSNPVSKRVIEITTEFVIGDGFNFETPNPRVEKFLRAFWEHEQNDLTQQIPEWADEAWRSGDLFLLVSLDQSGMAYVRAIPAENITEIQSKENDYRQETAYKRGALDENPYISYAVWKEQSEIKEFVLHFPLNRMVGAYFGESDMLSILYWINLFQDFVENRARLNHFALLFTYILQRGWKSDAEKKNYVNNFSALLPKKPGGVIALDSNETLSLVTPQLGGFEASQDALTIKRMIATGAGIPLHYLAEPEGATRTTADAAGTPVFKRFKRRQNYLQHVLLSVLQTACEIRRTYDSRIPAKPEINILVPDITERDNAQLAMGVQRITNAFIPLYNAKKITAKELIRLVYRFLAEQPPETIPDENMPISQGNSQAGTPGGEPASADEGKEPDPAAQDDSNE